MGDRITDVLAVLSKARRQWNATSQARAIQELRIGSVSAIAEREFTRGGRFKNVQSAKSTINDGLARRLGLPSLGRFDALLRGWLRSDAMELETTILKACWNADQTNAVESLFARV